MESADDAPIGISHPGLGEDCRIAGLDFEAGVRCYGSEQVYIKILQSYAKHSAAIVGKLKDCREDNLREYAVAVHGLKGSSYGIYAQSIGEQAELLEAAAKSGDFETLTAKNEAFIESMAQLLRELDALLDNARGAEQSRPVKDYPDDELLERMLAAAKLYKITVMEEIMDQIELCEYERGAELVAWMREQLDYLEYDAIAAKLEELTGRIQSAI
jgi:HPt (histidine-containing phosphotransfer) domain-containing protein